MQKKVTKEFQELNQGAPAASYSLDDLAKDYKNIKTLLSLLEPRSGQDTEILSLLQRLNKSIFSKMKALKGSEAPAPQGGLPEAPKGIIRDEQFEIEETTAMGGGNIQGTAGGIKIDQPLRRESKDVTLFRKYIKNILNELYDLDKDNFIANSKTMISEMMSTRSTGINYLGKFFLVARPIIEKEYLDLQTSQEQKDSMRDNLIKLYTDFLGQLAMNSNAADASSNFNESIVLEASGESMDGIYFDDFGYKDPVKEKSQKKGKDENLPEPHPGTEPTGAAAATRVFQATSKQLEEIFGSLGDKSDREMFVQYLPKNIVALFKQMPSTPQ